VGIYFGLVFYNIVAAMGLDVVSVCTPAKGYPYVAFFASLRDNSFFGWGIGKGMFPWWCGCVDTMGNLSMFGKLDCVDVWGPIGCSILVYLLTPIGRHNSVGFTANLCIACVDGFTELLIVAFIVI
jgi:hypothetical protein